MQAYCPGTKSPLNDRNPHALCIGCRNYLYAAEGMKPLMTKGPDGYDCVNLSPPKAKPQTTNGETT